MIGTIRTAIEWIGGTGNSEVGRGVRRLLGVGAVVLLVGLSGYLAAASGVTVDFGVGADDDRTVDGAISAAEGQAATGPGDGRPAGFVGNDPAATERDSDGDGLSDRAEREVHGTDPDDADTDGDGIIDGRELACTDAYPGADPLHQDVYVELDSVEGVSLSNESKTQLRTAFAAGPVENPDNESGIALHLVESEDALSQGDSVNDDRRPGAYNDVEDYRDAHHQYEAAGYHYLLVATNVAYNGDDHYAGAGRPGTAIVEHYDRDGVMSSLVMHELGHAFGIGRSKEGVDTRTYDRAGYDSVMNYNILYDTLAFSTGDDEVGRDEWEFVAEERHSPSTEVDDGFCPDVD